MKLLQLIVFCIYLWMPVSTMAAVKLQLPETISIVAINGKDFEPTDNVELPDGLNQIAIRYVADLGRSFDAERVSSDVFVLLFRAHNTTLAIHTPEINKKHQLKKFNSQPDISILNNSGSDVDFQVSKLNKEGFQLSRNYEKELTVFNQSSSSAAVATLSHFNSTVHEQPLPIGATGKSLSDEAVLVEQMLKYWYQHADEKTRERFKVWIKQ